MIRTFDLIDILLSRMVVEFFYFVWQKTLSFYKNNFFRNFIIYLLESTLKEKDEQYLKSALRR